MINNQNNTRLILHQTILARVKVCNRLQMDLPISLKISKKRKYQWGSLIISRKKTKTPKEDNQINLYLQKIVTVTLTANRWVKIFNKETLRGLEAQIKVRASLVHHMVMEQSSTSLNQNRKRMKKLTNSKGHQNLAQSLKLLIKTVHKMGGKEGS